MALCECLQHHESYWLVIVQTGNPRVVDPKESNYRVDKSLYNGTGGRIPMGPVGWEGFSLVVKPNADQVFVEEDTQTGADHTVKPVFYELPILTPRRLSGSVKIPGPNGLILAIHMCPDQARIDMDGAVEIPIYCNRECMVVEE